VRDGNAALVGLRRVSRACGGAMPDSAAVRGDVDLGRVVGVEKDAMAPLKVVAPDACPMGASVGGAVGRGVKAADIERIRIAGIDGQVVDVLRFREQGPPRLAAVVRGVDTAIPVGVLALLSPGREVKPLRIARVDLQAGWSGDARGKVDTLPVFRLVRRAIQGSGAGRGVVLSLAAASDN